MRNLPVYKLKEAEFNMDKIWGAPFSKLISRIKSDFLLYEFFFSLKSVLYPMLARIVWKLHIKNVCTA